MNLKLFFSTFILVYFFYTNIIYSQSMYENYKGALYESNKELFRTDQSPFFTRGIYRLNNISIEPKLTPLDSLKFCKSVTKQASKECASVFDCLYRIIPDSLIIIDVTADSMKFIHVCYSPILKSIFWDKIIKSYSENLDRVRPGYFSVSFSLNDIDGIHSVARFDFPQLTLSFKGNIEGIDNRYSLYAEFVMVKYRHFKDNSLRPIKKRFK